MTTRNIKLMEYCPDELASPEEQYDVRMGTLINSQMVALKDDEKLNLYVLPAALPENVEKVDVTDIHVSWIYLNENAKDLSAAKLAQMSVAELAPYVA